MYESEYTAVEEQIFMRHRSGVFCFILAGPKKNHST